MGRFIDLTGRKFGRLTVIDRVQNRGEKVAWKCLCECGNTSIVTGTALKSGKSKSCGCLKLENPSNLRHGKYGIRQYRIWIMMKQRCYNPKTPTYKHYGGRGITVCDEWLHNFQAFYDWAMANGYADDLTIDRKDVNGNYEPSNCRWATSEEQHTNTRRNVYFEYNGEKLTLSQLAHKYNIPVETLWNRIYKSCGGDVKICK